jgi:cytidylate kinase
MKITIGGLAGAGKSTIAKLLAKKLNLKHYSNGDFMRAIAEQKGLSLLQLSKLAEKDSSIDRELDERQIALGKTEDNFVIDSRLGFHFIPDSIKLFLDAPLKIRIERILADKSRVENNPNFEEAKVNIKKREKSELKRYKDYYNLNPYDISNFDFIIETTGKSPDKVADRIIELISNQVPK